MAESNAIACGFCAVLFQPRREWQKFCTTKCRMDSANGRRHEGLKLLAERSAVVVEADAALPREFSGGMVPATKVFKATKRGEPCMVAYGCAGDSNDCIAFQEWVRGGEKPSFKSLAVLGVDDEGRAWYMDEGAKWWAVGRPIWAVGRAWYMDEGAKWWAVGRPIWAVGSGADYAIGAMAAGKSAREAVEIATEWDVHTGMGVDVLEVAT